MKKMSQCPRPLRSRTAAMTHPRALDLLMASACCNIVLNSIVLASQLGFPQNQVLEERNLGQGVRLVTDLRKSKRRCASDSGEKEKHVATNTHSYSWGQLGSNWGIF